MDNNYIERTNISSVKVTMSQHQMKSNFENMLINVTDMIKKEGPIMSTWIRFRIGSNNSKEPIIFDTSSTNPKRNLIANLSITKSCAGTANKFTLVVQYDPFNMGQETAKVVEELDEYIAKAMSYDFGDDKNSMCGYLQYGYNSVSDYSLVSPEYKFFITEANSEVRFDSGISTYTFSGTSTLSADCDNSTDFPARENANILQVVEETLYYWYGTSENKPKHVGDIKPTENDYKYSIDVPDKWYNDSMDNINIEAMSGMSPIEYCQSLLNAYPLTKSEDESGLYENLAELNYALRPRYVLYIDDAAQSIRITHVVPQIQYDEDNKPISIAETPDLQISDFKFSWGTQTQHLITGWKPSVDTRLYLMRKARNQRAVSEIEKTKESGDEGAIKGIDDKLVALNDDLNEMFNAQIQLLGIPADPPLGLCISILPMILETVSRTSGVYMITGCSDEITSNGIYLTTLNLFRIKKIDDPTGTLPKAKPTDEDTKQPNSDNNQNDERLYWWSEDIVMVLVVLVNGNNYK